MKVWVLTRHDDGAYVAAPGSGSSYTRNLRRAQTFATKEAADRNRCGNETAVPLETQLRRPTS